MTRQDERPEERRRPHSPAWATVPTMAWRRVAEDQGLDEEEIERVERRRPPAADDAEPGRPVPTQASRAPDERGPVDRGQARVPSPGERRAAERAQPGRGDDRPERGYEPGRGDRALLENGAIERTPGDRRPVERDRAGRDHSDRGERPGRGRADRRTDDRDELGYADLRRDDRGHSDRGHSDRGPGSRGQDDFGADDAEQDERTAGADRYPPELPRSRQREPRPSYGQIMANPQRGPRRGAIRLTPPGVQPGLYAGSGHRVVSPDALTAPTPPGGLPYSGTATVPADGLAEEDAIAVGVPAEPEIADGDGAEPDTSTPEDTGPDPEQVLASWEWSFDPETLREIPDDPDRLREVRESLTAKLNSFSDNPRRARLLSLRAVVSRILGDLPKALADGKLALAHAEATGELRRIAIAQARLAHVLQWRGEFEEADRLFALANSSELPDRLRATMHQHSGKCAYDQGRYIEACNHFERALELRKEEDPQLIAQTEMALDAVFTRVAQNGWGPYPRGRDEILQLGKAPTPALDEGTGLWGYIDSEGETVVGAEYDDVQPFRDGVAWVQRPGAQNWELIDEAGQTLIPVQSGYVGVSSFSDGLAWVSRDGNARWIGIDKANNVTISTGFDDVRPFRRGMAAVRRGRRWGAVDGVGRVIVPFAYDGFATAMSDGRYIDGFSDEGLAVVEVSGRKGVVDRAGRVLVEPVHPAVVIHPVAFLITDGKHRWGALDRRGRPLIPPTHPSRMGVSDEIDRLLSDARPVL